jgi:preprotein translocase subunit YajC
LIQTCNEDLVENELLAQIDEQLKAQFDGPLNSCAATCPNLYEALSIYVATLEMFTFALILPLLFLPCIYLWFLRRATAEAEAFAHLQERMQEEENILNNGGITAGEIMDSLEKVKLVAVSSVNSETGESERQIILIPEKETDISKGELCETKDCCICMNDFKLCQEIDVKEGKESEESTSRICSHGQEMVRTPCGHMFHTDCLYGWVGGMWQIDPQAQSEGEDVDPEVWAEERRQRRARQTCCPLCRKDLRPNVQ